MTDNETLKLQCWAACHAGQLETVTDCIAQGCDINGVVDGINTCLSISVHAGHEDVVRYLLANGVDVNDTTRRLDPLPLLAALTHRAAFQERGAC